MPDFCFGLLGERKTFVCSTQTWARAHSPNTEIDKTFDTCVSIVVPTLCNAKWYTRAQSNTNLLHRNRNIQPRRWRQRITAYLSTLIRYCIEFPKSTSLISRFLCSVERFRQRTHLCRVTYVNISTCFSIRRRCRRFDFYSFFLFSFPLSIKSYLISFCFCFFCVWAEEIYFNLTLIINLLAIKCSRMAVWKLNRFNGI